MTALELVSLINQILFVGLFVAVAWRAARQPSRSNLNVTLLFGGIGGAVVASTLSDITGFTPEWLPGVLFALLVLCPLAMLRLVDDFRGTPRWVQLGGLAVFAVIATLALVAFGTQPLLVELAALLWFLLVGGYAAVTFAGASRRSRGLTRWRMAAVALGAYTFIAAIVVVLTGALVPDVLPWSGVAAQVLALLSVVSFFAGFVPPAWLRRAWREPSLRDFLERSLALSGVADDRRLVLELQHAAADTLGAPGAALGLADGEGRTLRWISPDGKWEDHPADAFVGGRAFTQQRRIIAGDARRTDPEHAETYDAYEARAVIAVPVTAEDRRLGVLTVYGARSPIFVEDDLWLLQLLADQMAVILEARRMAGEAAELQAREETTALKEEFLSAAAHDLRTPLTVLLGQAELLERRLGRTPAMPPDPAGIRRLARETRRLRDLVTDLLDAQRLDELGPTPDGQRVDLAEVIRSSLERFGYEGAEFTPDLPDEPLVVSIDRPRLEQVLDNLIENARKYASGAQPIVVRAWRQGDETRMAVIDHGIGIPESERAMVFDRFYRASNVQARTDRGLGLGLFICRRIIESHGGRIWVEETPGGGSTFVVAFRPLAPGADVADAAQAPMDEPVADGIPSEPRMETERANA